MLRLISPLVRSWSLSVVLLSFSLQAQSAAPAQGASTGNPAIEATTANLAKSATTRAPDLLEHIVDVVLQWFHVKTGENTTTHMVICCLFLAAAILLRRLVTTIIFNLLKRLAAKTETTLDDKLFPALEAPVATFVMVTGIFAALKVLKLSETVDRSIGYGSTVAFSLVIFWGLLRAFNAILDHASEMAKERQMGVAAFMPWIKKTLVALFVVIGVLITIQSLGYNVSTILSGLGIGGLAFALAAQDTIANLFGSLVVAIDQPFKVGETVKIGANTGTVEEIGLRSTKIRLVDKSLVVIPNKLVSSEAITNLSRFTQRRIEQVIGINYGATPEQLRFIVEDIRQCILAEAAVDTNSVMVFFRDLSASSLDLWIVYVAQGPDFQQSLALKQRVNLEIMRLVAARGLTFAFPSSVMHLDGPIAKQIVAVKS
jgi:MscS family membrane protein